MATSIDASARTSILAVVAMLLGSFASARMATATVMYTVPNAGFESPATSFYTNSAPTSWTMSGMGGVMDETVGSTPSAVEGDQFAWMDSRGNPTVMYTKVADTPGLGDWTLGAYVARRDHVSIPLAPYGIALYADTNSDNVPDQLLAEEITPVTPGQTDGFLPTSVTAYNVPAGTALYIRLRTLPDPDTATAEQTLLDALTVGYDEVPEPATLSLLAIGGIAVIARRRSP